MSEGVNQPLVLRKKSRSSRFASWSGDANRFYDKMLRVFYIFLLFAIDFAMFIYSINGKLIEGGTFNQAVLFILGGIFAFSFVLILLLSFSKDLQNGVCALVTMLIVVVFFNQFALFNVDTFIEEWLEKKASWLTFIGIVPAAWLVGLLLGVIIFFAFRSTFAMLFITMVLMFAGLIGIKKNEFLPQPKGEYSEIKALGAKAGEEREGNLVYFMLPKFPSYQFLNSIRDHNFRELRDLMVGFYALNNFEIYPNAFVKKNETVSNMIDIFNQVDYTSTTSGNRAYSEFINSWDFIHGGLDYFSLEENRLYDYLWENGYGISKDLKNITRFHDAGVTYITLCHTRNNDICDSSSDTTARWNGLSPYGRKVVKEMNRLGIMIDLSHAAESTFWDVLKYSKAPVIVSHSSASAIYRHDRNLTDEQLRALAAHGGVAQACLVDEFLNPDAKKTNLTDFMKHLLHMVEVAGIDHVGIGSDFDGGGGVKGCNGDNDFINITVRLLEHGFTETDIAKIWGGNFLRVMKQVQTK